MPERRSPRRRQEKAKTTGRASPPRRARWPWVLAAFGVIAVAGATYAALRLPWLTVQEVRVAGAESLDSTALIEMSGLRGKSMLNLPAAEVRKNLLSIPQLRSVSLDRTWPRTVTLRIEERKPWGFWTVGGRDYPIDIEGMVLAGGAPSVVSTRIVEPDTTRVMGPGDRVDPDAIALADRVFRESPRVLGRGVKELEYRSGVGITAVFEGGMRATFGDERAYEYKIAALSRLLDKLRSQGTTPRAVDLRFGERLTYE